MAATASSSSSALAKSGNSAPLRSSVPITRVAIRNSKTISINDHIYVSTPWAPGAGEPYFIARVMEFVTASSSRKGAQALASSSGTLHVRANLFLRQRDLHNKSLSDSRLLVATMHSEIFALENVRGICVVRHRDLIGEAPAISTWKKREDHFYYHQLYDRFLHRFYDVIPTEKVRNAPLDVLTTLRNRYSFVIAEPSTTPDLCGTLRGCSVCQKWASSAESVRCDTCKLFFHMHCLTPPLASKPAKGYSWTCAPCSRRHETIASGLPLSRTAALDASAAISSSSANTPSSDNLSESASYTVNRLSDASGRKVPTKGRGGARGRGRGTPMVSQALGRAGHLASEDIGSDASRESSPLPTLALTRRTIDDERGTRCFNRWPYRYFGECTEASEIMDAHDSVYPRQVARIGVKYQASPITWEEQKTLGMGVRISKEIESSDGTLTPVSEEPSKMKKMIGRSNKKKKDETPLGTPVLSNIPLPTSTSTPDPVTLVKVVPEKEIERGTEESIEPLYLPGSVDDKTVDKYIKVCKKQLPEHASQIGMLDRALILLTRYRGEAGRALHELTNSSNEDLEVDIWSPKEMKQFDKTVNDYSADLRFLKREIPSKTSAQLVRYFVQWKCKQLSLHYEQEKKMALEKGTGDPTNTTEKADQSTRAVSPSLSIMLESEEKNTQNQLPSKVCKICTTSASSLWYKGPVVWHNRRLCVNCGLYWRKYAAEMPLNHQDVVVTRKREAAAHDDVALGVAPPIKAAKMARVESSAGATKGVTPPQTVTPTFEPGKCVLCKKLEPKKKLTQCRQCSLSVHQGCYGLSEGELASDVWFCEACTNERALDAALTPQCILCPRTKSMPLLPASDASSLAVQQQSMERNVSRSRKSVSNPPSANGNISFPPMGALDAVKPTEGNNWVHVHCALFIPEVSFTEPERMRIVEGAGFLPLWRFEAKCDLCNLQEGACIGCAEPSCKRVFHASCASQQSSFVLGLDLVPVKSTRRDTVITTTFRGETGHMSAVVYCNTHKDVGKSRKLLDLAEIDSSSGLTATQVFVQSHKGVKNSISNSNDQSSYPLLRRAKRFDSVLLGSSSPSSITSVSGLSRRSSKQPLQQPHTLQLSTTSAANASTTEEEGNSSGIEEVVDDKSLLSSHLHSHSSAKACLRCKTHFSPFWWNLPRDVEETQENANKDWMNIFLNTWTPGEDYFHRFFLCVRCRHAVLPPLLS